MNLTNVILATGGGLFHGDSNDAEEVNSAGPLLMKYTQVEPGPFLGRGSLLVLPNVTVALGALNRGTVARGTVLQDHICVYGSVSPGLSLDFDRQSLQPQALAVTSPNCDVELYSSRSRRGFQIAIGPEAWRHSASALDIAGVPSSGADVRTTTAGQWAFLLHRLNWINAAIQLYPESFEQPAVRRELEQDLIELLIVVSGPRQSQEPRGGSIPARQHAVRRVRAHVQDHMEWPLTLTDLCTATGLGARSLQIAFREKLQISPMQYVRAERLNRAHSLLRENRCGSVSEAACRCGYWHMAQFAADYRRMFHETPSETLRRGRSGLIVSSIRSGSLAVQPDETRLAPRPSI